MAGPMPTIHLMIFLSLCLIITSSNAGFAKNHSGEDYHDSHIFSVTSFQPSTLCKRLPKGGTEFMEVVHKYGACSTLLLGDQTQTNQSKFPSYKKIKMQDRRRAALVHSRVSKKVSSNKETKASITVADKNEDLLHGGASDAFGSLGDYFITIGLGSPKQYVSLIIDTGSDLTWTQCEPCANCYKQKGPYYNPFKSKTYRNTSCGSKQCHIVNPEGTYTCVEKTCTFRLQYGDNSTSVGYVGTETLTLPSADGKRAASIPGFVFGCGISNADTVGTLTAGIMGLSPEPSSIVQQTSHLYNKYFSYCLPAYSSQTGYLKFGKTNEISNKFIKYTPMKRSTTFYYIQVTGISLGGKMLPIPSSVFTKAGAIIDSGTVQSQLPPLAYKVFTSAFVKKMRKYKMIKSDDGEICYDFSANDKVEVPKVSIFLEGGVELEQNVNGGIFLMDTENNVLCLAYSSNNEDTEKFLLANAQHRGVEVVYDIRGHRIGFAPNAC